MSVLFALKVKLFLCGQCEVNANRLLPTKMTGLQNYTTVISSGSKGVAAYSEISKQLVEEDN